MVYVNGPVNAFRLEGKVDGVKKVIYLFGDYHFDVRQQTQCDDIRAIEIKDYLIKNFEGNNKMKIDFFMEAYVINVLQKKDVTISRWNYIHILWNFFEKIFNFDKNKNKVVVSKEFPNVRMHYFDFRDTFIYDAMFVHSPNLRTYFMETIWRTLHPTIDKLTYVKNKLLFIKKQIDFIYSSIYEKFDFTIDSNMKLEQKIYLKMINKLLNVYKNNDVKNILNRDIKNEVKESFNKYYNIYDKLINIIDKQINYLKKNKYPSTDVLLKDYLPQIMQLLLNMIDGIFNIGSNIIDVYMMRRFLDKTYITNAVAYTGAAHSIRYIYILVKYFNFKITNASYTQYDLGKTHDIIKKSKSFSYDKFKNIFIHPELIQCSDLKGFPKNFQ